MKTLVAALVMVLMATVASPCGTDYMQWVQIGQTVPKGRYAMTVPFRERLTISAYGNMVASHWQAAFNKRPWMTLPYSFSEKHFCELQAADIDRQIRAHMKERPLNEDEMQKAYVLLTQVHHAECVESDGSDRFKARTNERQ
ncbi:MAG: hypothetical protein KGJ90_01955 [Patescibacteria group bacterium]|nr:hypothetical protein [Patescibacteria group bacterium]